MSYNLKMFSTPHPSIQSTSKPYVGIIPPPIDMKKPAQSNATLRIARKPSNKSKIAPMFFVKMFVGSAAGETF